MKILDQPIRYWIATWFGSGLLSGFLKIGGGTWGSLATLPICWVFLVATSDSSVSNAFIAWFIIQALLLLLGIVSIPISESILGAQKNWKGVEVKHDHNQIDIDEVWGMFVTIVPMLFCEVQSLPLTLFIAFLLFRLFDIIKLWPANRLDQWVSKWGVMLDDGVAALQSALCLTLLIKFLHI